MEEIDLKELLKIFNERKFLIITSVLLFCILGVIYSYYFVTPKYTALTKIVLTKDINDSSSINGSQINYNDITLNSKLISTYSELVKSKDVLRKVKNDLHLDIDESILEKNISVKAVGDSEVLSIEVTNEDPVIAADIANKIGEIIKIKVQELFKIDNVSIVDTADIPNRPSNIHHSLDLVIFAASGFGIAIIYILIANMLDTTVKTAEEIEKNYNVPILASIPQVDLESKKA